MLLAKHTGTLQDIVVGICGWTESFFHPCSCGGGSYFCCGEKGERCGALPCLSVPPTITPPAPLTIWTCSSPRDSATCLTPFLHHLGLQQQQQAKTALRKCTCFSPPLLCCFWLVDFPTICFAHQPHCSSLPPFSVLPAPPTPCCPFFWHLFCPGPLVDFVCLPHPGPCSYPLCFSCPAPHLLPVVPFPLCLP